MTNRKPIDPVEILDAETIDEHGNLIPQEADQSGDESGGALAIMNGGAFKLPAPIEYETAIKDAVSKMLSDVDEQLASRTVDLSTKAGRDRVASEAYAISRTKTATIAKARELVKEQKDIIAVVNASVKQVEEEFDKRRDIARAPLTEWEETAAKVIERAKAERAFMLTIRAQQVDGVTVSDMNAAQLGALLEIRRAMTFTEADFGEDFDALAQMNLATIQWVETAQQAAQKAEADATELEELRALKAEMEERKAREAAEAAARKAEEEVEAQRAKEREEAAARLRADQDAEAEKLARDFAELDEIQQTENALSADEIGRLLGSWGVVAYSDDEIEQRAGAHNAETLKAARDAAEKALRAALSEAVEREAKAAEEARIEAERAAKIRAEKEAAEIQRRADEAAAAQIQKAKDDAAAEIRRAQEEAEAREKKRADEERARLEQEARDKAQAEAVEKARTENEEHRRGINAEILRDLAKLGVNVELGKAIVIAVNRGQVGNMTINY